VSSSGTQSRSSRSAPPGPLLRGRRRASTLSGLQLLGLVAAEEDHPSDPHGRYEDHKDEGLQHGLHGTSGAEGPVITPDASALTVGPIERSGPKELGHVASEFIHHVPNATLLLDHAEQQVAPRLAT